MQRRAWKSWKRALRGWFPLDRSTPILDIGCGEGAFLCFLRELGFSRLEGFDLSEENVALCHAQGLNLVRRFDACRLKDWAPERTYGAIYALDVVEHLPKQYAAEFVAEIRRRLIPGGFVVLETPNMGNLWACWRLHYCLSHEWGLTETTAVTLMMLAGFEEHEIEVRPCWSATTPAGRMRERYSSLIHRLLWLTEPGGRPTICTPNLLIRAVRT
jgi:2-polyprenyl-3-methyl-5-hydroxy-6-metoxy-1,4-benzoquinol methylase